MFISTSDACYLHCQYDNFPVALPGVQEKMQKYDEQV